MHHTHYPSIYLRIAFAFALFRFVTFATGALTNVTVDDQGGDPASKYSISYTTGWNLGQKCIPGCEAQPDASQAHSGTWSDTTYDPSIEGRNTPQNATFDFTGG